MLSHQGHRNQVGLSGERPGARSRRAAVSGLCLRGMRRAAWRLGCGLACVQHDRDEDAAASVQAVKVVEWKEDGKARALEPSSQVVQLREEDDHDDWVQAQEGKGAWEVHM